MTKFKISPLLVIIICLPLLSLAQNEENLSWRKHRKLAEEYEEKGFFQQAAENYEKAFSKNTDKKELIYKAGENYYKVKNFYRAAESFKYVKDEKGKEFDLAGLKYARSLKQDGQYESAGREFLYFLENYKGDYKSELSDIITNDIKGCELAQKLKSEPQPKDLVVKHLDEKVNTIENELAPIPFSDDILYFTSTMNGKQAQIYRTQKKNGRWAQSTEASGLPRLSNIHLANGTFTPDGQRFYYTQCPFEREEKKKKKKDDKQTAQCEIYMIKRTGSSWSEPQRLRDYINQPGFTTTHPCVYQTDGKEYLYFSSDREGGKGGMDIWYAVRDLRSDDIDFTFPKNAGSSINTKGDEITPFYDVQEGNLYFSSNGHITIGGYDIFKSKGSGNNWETAQNMGLPYNSSVDDFYFTMKKNGNGGFFVSNRTVINEKILTTNEDIFEFEVEKPVIKVYARGSIFDKNSLSLVKSVNVTLNEIDADGAKNVLTNKTFNDGVYEFEVMENKSYELEFEKSGYSGTTLKVVTNTKDGNTLFGESVYLATQAIASEVKPSEVKPKVETTPTPSTTSPTTKPTTTASTTTPPSTKTTTTPKPTTTTAPKPTATTTPTETTNPATTASVNTSKPITTKPTPTPKANVPTESKPTTPNTKTTETTVSTTPPVVTSTPSKKVVFTPMEEPTAEAATEGGVIYKVQLGAFKNFDENNPKFQKLDEYGVVELDQNSAPGLTRIVVGSFAERKDANELRVKVRHRGFRDAFVAKYVGGKRQ